MAKHEARCPLRAEVAPATRLQLRTLATLMRSATDTSTIRFVAAELERIGRHVHSAALPSSALSFDVQLCFASAFEPTDADPDPVVEARLQEALARLGPDAVARLQRAQTAIIDRIEKDPEWALEFTLLPLAALQRLDPLPDRALLVALARAGGGPDQAFTRGDERVRIVGAGRAPTERGRDHGID